MQRETFQQAGAYVQHQECLPGMLLLILTMRLGLGEFYA